MGISRSWTWTKREQKVEHGKRGSNIEELRRIKILRQEKHTNKGTKLMNFGVCIWHVHIHVLACCKTKKKRKS